MSEKNIYESVRDDAVKVAKVAIFFILLETFAKNFGAIGGILVAVIAIYFLGLLIYPFSRQILLSLLFIGIVVGLTAIVVGLIVYFFNEKEKSNSFNRFISLHPLILKGLNKNILVKSEKFEKKYEIILKKDIVNKFIEYSNQFPCSQLLNILEKYQNSLGARKEIIVENDYYNIINSNEFNEKIKEPLISYWKEYKNNNDDFLIYALNNFKIESDTNLKLQIECKIFDMINTYFCIKYINEIQSTDSCVNREDFQYNIEKLNIMLKIMEAHKPSNIYEDISRLIDKYKNTMIALENLVIVKDYFRKKDIIGAKAYFLSNVQPINFTHPNILKVKEQIFSNSNQL